MSKSKSKRGREGRKEIYRGTERRGREVYGGQREGERE